MHDLARKMGGARSGARCGARRQDCCLSRYTCNRSRDYGGVSHRCYESDRDFLKECVDERREGSSAYKGEHPETGHHQDDRQKPPLLVLAEKGHEISDERGLGLVRGPLEGGSFMTRVGLLHLWHPQNWRK